MKIALIGYGKMGKEVEKIALLRNHNIVKIIDFENSFELAKLSNSEVDVAIEFTTPLTCVANMLTCFDINLPIVCGTTAWHDKLDMVSARCVEHKQSLFYSSNFSLGVNLFYAVNEYVAQIMSRFEEYNISLEEIHHTQKKDAPSGTAITLVDKILPNYPQKNSGALDFAISKEQIPIRSVREGQVIGTHKVCYESENDKIELIHEAKNRKGLATGAVLAAEFLLGKKGVFTMHDLLNI